MSFIVVGMFCPYPRNSYGLLWFGTFGLQAGILLLAVVGVKFLRHHLNFLYVIPQILGVAIITIMQALVMACFCTW